MKVLLDSEWFCRLPAPARVKIVDELMTDLSRVHVWGFLDCAVWDGDWTSLLGKDMLDAINNFNFDDSNSNSQSRGRAFPPQYQFNIGQVGQGQRRRPVQGVFNFASRAVVGSTWWLIQKTQGGQVPLLSAVGLFVASGFNSGLQMGLPLVLSLLSGTENSTEF
eukprot:g3929.t2